MYGAGNVGKQFYNQIVETNFCEIVLWLDKNADGILTKKPEAIASLGVDDYDFVVIGIENEVIVFEVKDFLMNHGVFESRILHQAHIGLLSTVRLEASTICQLNCKSCIMRKNNSGTVGKGFLKFENFKKFVDKNKSIKTIELSNYGEIFLNPELLDIIKYAYLRKVRLQATNGVNFNTLSDEMLDGLVKYKFLYLLFSIDGASQDIYSQYRCGGNFDTVISNVKKLIEYKKKHNSDLPKLAWQYILMSHNECDVIKAKEIAQELRIPINFKLSWDKGITFNNPEMLKQETGLQYLTREEYLSFKGEIYSSNICRQLFDGPQINWDGRLLGCCGNAIKGDYGVNVFEIGLNEALKSPNYILAKKMLIGKAQASENPVNIPCAVCPIYKHMVKTNSYLQGVII
ncbi:MAG: hypothetical protein LBU89_08520 [Fibromonadaceae bacterium]|nr:hypothetical protein [Fibromonadaceae bacterium]